MDWEPCAESSLKLLEDAGFPKAADRIRRSDERIHFLVLEVERLRDDLEERKERVRDLEGQCADLQEQIARALGALLGREV